MDISNLSISELEDLYSRVPAEIKKRRIAEKEKVLEEIKTLAAKHGFELDDLIEGGRRHAASPAAKGTRKPAAIKYRHPSQPELTWTGRGRQPKWIVDWLKSGNRLQDLKI